MNIQNIHLALGAMGRQYMDTLGSGAWEEAGAMEGLWKLWSRQRGMDNKKRKES